MIVDIRIIGERMTYKCWTCRRWAPAPDTVSRQVAALVGLYDVEGWRTRDEAQQKVRYLRAPLRVTGLTRRLPAYGVFIVCGRCKGLAPSRFSAMAFAARLRTSAE